MSNDTAKNEKLAKGIELIELADKNGIGLSDEEKGILLGQGDVVSDSLLEEVDGGVCRFMVHETMKERTGSYCKRCGQSGTIRHIDEGASSVKAICDPCGHVWFESRETIQAMCDSAKLED